MHPAVKAAIGIILILIGLSLFVDQFHPIISQFRGIPQIAWWTNFIVVLTGVIPAFLILVGLFVVWLEIDEMKIERQLKAEEKKAKKGRKKK